MKKFSTIALLLAFSFPAFHATQALADEVKLPKQSGKCSFLPDAPDRHTVVKGDTLWDISGRFLQNPWCWPEVWGMNREEIRNPHWIYPGQIVYFDRVNNRLMLGNPLSSNGDGTARDGKISPQIRTGGISSDAIPSIPASLIEPFLLQPLIVGKDELATAPRIVAAQEGHVNIGKDDKAYVRGDLGDNKLFQVFRPGQALKDPETKAVIGYEAVYVGELKLIRTKQTPDGVDTFVVTSSKEEIGIGDRLRPAPATPIRNYVPHAPERAVNGRVVSIYGGVAQAGQYQVISINRGSRDGLELGNVLKLSHTGKLIKDVTEKKSIIRLPDEEYGTLFVFRIFENISYGLIMRVTEPVAVGDSVISPE